MPIHFPCTCRFTKKDEFSQATLIEDTECGYHACKRRDVQHDDTWIQGKKSQELWQPGTTLQQDKERHVYFYAANGLIYHLPPKDWKPKDRRDEVGGGS